MPLEPKCYDSIFRFDIKNHDWFADDIDSGKFKYKKIKA
jgi:hypothetical protein